MQKYFVVEFFICKIMNYKSYSKEYEMDIIKTKFVFNKQNDGITKLQRQQLKYLCYVKYNGYRIKYYSTKIQ
jgi:hypothetical protein